MTVHLTLHGTVTRLRGWGSTASGWPVRIELRDPGLFAVVRVRTVGAREIAVLELAQLEMGVNTVQLRRGGNFVGGGLGITGTLKGMAIAGMMNRMSHQEWEETRLRATETLATGARRTIIFTLPAHTPASLLEQLWPAIDTWSQQWVQAILEGRLQPFHQNHSLPAVYAQIDAVTRRALIRPDQARTLSAHYTAPLLARSTPGCWPARSHTRRPARSQTSWGGCSPRTGSPGRRRSRSSTCSRRSLQRSAKTPLAEATMPPSASG